MSFIQQVLSSAGETELDQVKLKLPDLTANVEKCEYEVTSYLDSVYVKFIETPKHNRILVNKLDMLHNELFTFKQNIENAIKKSLPKIENDLEDYAKLLEASVTKIAVLQELINVHESLISIRKLQKDKQLSKCMKKIVEFNQFSLNPDNNELDVLDELKQQIMSEETSLLHTINTVFKNSVICSSSKAENTIKIIDSNDELPEILLSLYLYNSSVFQLDNLKFFLLDHVFTPVIKYVTDIKISNDDGSNVLTIITRDCRKMQNHNQVFSHIKQILQFLIDYFNFPLGDKKLTTLRYIGSDISDSLCDLIINNCLQKTIPSTKTELVEYNGVIQETEQLEKKLIDSQILDKPNSSILNFFNNVDVLFVDKKCQEYLQKAELQMRKDLHDIVEVGVVISPSELETITDYPKSSVSKNVLDLLKLIEDILIQVPTVDFGERLLGTISDIIKTYTIFVPEFHKKFLQTIPQQVAIFYNNCFYMAHKLTEFTGSYSSGWSSLVNTAFKNDGLKLRTTGLDLLTNYVTGQIKQVDDIMKDANLQSLRILTHVDLTTEKCLRQCLRQQELLKTVWMKVLPYDVYNRNMGLILDRLCNNLIKAVVQFEDISSEAAAQLVEILKIVTSRGPKLFTAPREVTLFVELWYKLNELLFVLSASLLDINDRWVNGKGPRAFQFQPDELKQLIRALFQNTERRANLLAKI